MYYDPLNVSSHGGHCCGARHIWGFSAGCTEFQRRRLLKSAINRALDESRSKKKRRLLEVILKESQLTDWCHILEEFGFKQVYSFLNSNSGNECHVFLLETNRPGLAPV